MSEREFRKARGRHRGGFAAVVALGVALAGLGLPGSKLLLITDEPIEGPLQVLFLTARTEITEFLANLPAELDPAELIPRVAGNSWPAGIERRQRGKGGPVAYIVVQGSPTPGAEGAGGAALAGDDASSGDGSAPGAPSDVRAVALSDATVELTWTPPRGGGAGVHYEVVREGATETVTATGASVVLGNLRGASSYCYKIAAVDAQGNRSPEIGPVCATTPDRLPPTSPGRAQATVQGPDTVVLEWAESVDDAGPVTYEVLDGSVVVATVPTTTWTHSGAEPRQHRYSVLAIDTAGNRSVASPPTVVALGDVEPPSPPAQVKLDPVSPTQMRVAWAAATDNRGVDRYEVLSKNQVVATSRSTSATVVALSEWDEHCFSIRAIDGAGNKSTATQPVCARTLERTAWDAARKDTSGANYYQR